MKQWTTLIAIICAILAVGGIVEPIHSLPSRLATIAGLAGLWAVLAMLCWRWGRARRGGAARVAVMALPLALVGAAVALVCLPGKGGDADLLRKQYVENLRQYEGVPYVWGGENGLGIDCSGLPRRAYRDALAARGMATLNGAYIRRWLGQWWNDAGAHGMAQCDGGRLVPVAGADASRGDDGLLAGDVAVVNQDTHVLVYLGKGEWIEADPAGRVVIHTASQGPRPWLGLNPRVFRWRELVD